MATARAYFEEEAGAYTERSDGGLWAWWRRYEKRVLWSLLRPRAGERILDAGCGSGYYTRALLRSQALPIAADLSLGMATSVLASGLAPAVVADLHRVPFGPHFDAVLCAGALEFVADPGEVVASMAACIRRVPRARLVVMAPAADAAGDLYQRFHARHGLAIKLFTRGSMKRMAEGAGMQVVEIRRAGFNLAARMEW